MTKIALLAALAVLAPAALACTPPPDPGPDAPACVAPMSGPTMHASSVTSDETWTADASPHIVTSSISVTATITIEPCSEVQLADGVTVTVGANGRIQGEGTATTPITIDGSGAAWTSVRAIGGTVRLAHTNVSGGGGFFAQHGSDPKSPVAALSFDHVTITGSKTSGVVLRGTTFEDGSTALAIHGSGSFPVDMNPMAFGNLPDGDYTGNATDAIQVIAGVGNGVTSDTTAHDRGVPYIIGNDAPSADLRVGTETGGVATLTIEPGVTFAFAPGGILEVEHYDNDNFATGALVALGLPVAPITFTSAAPVPIAGDWLGVWFAARLDPRDVLAHVNIVFAGKASTTIAGCPLNTQVQAALVIVSHEPPPTLLTGSLISDSGKDGIFRGWIGEPVDLSATTLFTNVPHCKQTNVATGQGVCPATTCQ